MNRILFGIVLMIALVGCTNIQQVGPLAKQGGPASAGAKDKDLAQSDPVMIPAPTPVAPKCIVHAEDVNADNTDLIQKELQAEFDFDKKHMPMVPVTAEITHPQ